MMFYFSLVLLFHIRPHHHTFLILKFVLIQFHFRLLRNADVYILFRELAILSDMNPFHTFIPYLFKV